MPRVTRTDGFEAYQVRGGHGDYEWATILIRGFQATGNDGQPREVGEILIHSSFGSWAYQWGHLGQPFKGWIAGCDDRSYVAEKFLGSKARVFDGDATVRELRRRIIAWRREGDFDKDQARVVWDWIEENEIELSTSADSFCNCMYGGARDCEVDGRRRTRGFFDEPWELTYTTLDHQFAGFWRDIMPPFQEALRAELAQAKEVA